MMKQENRRAALVTAALIVLFALVIAALTVFYPSLIQQTPSGDLAVSETVQEASEGLDDIAVICSFDPQKATLTGTQTLRLTNRTGEEQPAVVLRSWSGAYLEEDTSPAASEEWLEACYSNGFQAGGLHMLTATIGEREDTSPFLFSDEAKTVLRVVVPQGWQAGETLTLTLTWRVDIPECASRFGVSDGLWALGNVFPVPAVWENGAWRTDGYSSIGDSFYSECANWTVDLTAPDGYAVASTGYAAPQKKDGLQTWHLTMPAVRDFALTLSDRYESAVSYCGDTLIVARAQTRSRAKKLVKTAKSALTVFEKHWGSYPWPVFTVAETAIAQGGMEYPCCVMISSAIIDAGGETLEQSVVHETAHQWWYALAGSDPVNQPWQDEALCEYSLMVYLGDKKGAMTRADAVSSRIESAMRLTFSRSLTPGAPLSWFQDTNEYTWIVYRRGAAFFLAMEQLMGQEALDSALRSYAEQYAFRLAGRDDLLNLLSQAAGMDISGLAADYLDTCLNN